MKMVINVNDNLAAAAAEAKRLCITRNTIENVIKYKINRVLDNMDIATIVADIRNGEQRMCNVFPKNFGEITCRDISINNWSSLIVEAAVLNDYTFEQDGCVISVTNIKKQSPVSGLTFDYIISLAKEKEED